MQINVILKPKVMRQALSFQIRNISKKDFFHNNLIICQQEFKTLSCFLILSI